MESMYHIEKMNFGVRLQEYSIGSEWDLPSEGFL